MITPFTVLFFVLLPVSVSLENFHFHPQNFSVCAFSTHLNKFHPFADDPFGDPKIIGDPYCTVFVGRLSHLTTEDTLRKVNDCALSFKFYKKFVFLFFFFVISNNDFIVRL